MSPPPDQNSKFEGLLDFLRQTRGFDFTGYKRPSLMRRVNRRMGMINIRRYDDYVDYLEVHPDEFGRLFNTILINVNLVFPRCACLELFQRRSCSPSPRNQRTGRADTGLEQGCASGEEAYTVAILLAEAMGLEPLRQKVKIYATDVDEEALAVARVARQMRLRDVALESSPLARIVINSNGHFVVATQSGQDDVWLNSEGHRAAGP